MALEIDSSSNNEPFPWHIGVFDAHCHPTDTMSSIDRIQSMKTRVLTVMSTRSQDQDLVASTADKYSIQSSNCDQWSQEEWMIPCFGWHPWFSHQMYIDGYSDRERVESQEPGNLTGDAKIAHYRSVLTPSREALSEEDRQTYLSLPDPMPFSTFLTQTRRLLQRYPHALVGEVGLDRSFRIPQAWVVGDDFWSKRDPSLTPGGREGRRLTSFRCDMKHQKKILKLQLQLAAELGRGVSVHGVAAHGVLFEALQELWKGNEKEVLTRRERKKQASEHRAVGDDLSRAPQPSQQPLPYPPRICLHSFSGNKSIFKPYMGREIPVQIFASFSTAINLSDAPEKTPASFEELIKTVPDHMLLVESDLHTAGDGMDRRMEDIVRRICKIKGWGLEEGVQQLGNNWKTFVFGEL